MNILFIDCVSKEIKKSLMLKLFGFEIRKTQNDTILSLNINEGNYNKSVLKIVLKHIFKRQKVYVVKSRKLNNLNLDYLGIDTINITEQNNLYNNDINYIKKYISKNNIEPNKVRILVVIDKLEDRIKEKIMYLISRYKVVDIYTKSKSAYFYSLDFAEKINRELGSTMQILDKEQNLDYNILLVFSHKTNSILYKNKAYVLDYNDSNQDVDSITYKMYLQNELSYINLFKTLDMNLCNFERTKLGKLCMHTGWNNA